jgi:hypothetical protein
MARTLTEIYTIAKGCRNQYLELTEFQNSSKMSILDAFTWVSSACIWAFENILDVFKIDLARDLQNRINGTPAYYANALMKYQSGDKPVISEDGATISYPTVEETKRVVTKVSYYEYQEDGFYDKGLLLKIATGDPGYYKRIESEELLMIRAYLNQILFAGSHATVVSRNGDILIPRVTAYYDGAVSEEEVYGNIEKSLNEFIANLDFNGVVYVQKVIDAIQQADHVLDVYVSNKSSDLQGIFVAQYDDDNHLIVADSDVNGDPVSYEQRIDRLFIPNSGFIKQSTKSGEEAGLQTWKESIVLKLEG